MGFPKETMATISVFMFPFTCLVSALVGRFLLREYETTWLLIGYVLTFIDTIITYYFVISFKELGGYNE